MKRFYKGLCDIHSKVDLKDSVESIQLYLAAYAVINLLKAHIDEKEVPGRSYIFEKLDEYAHLLQNAVFPFAKSNKAASEWLEDAGFGLNRVEELLNPHFEP